MACAACCASLRPISPALAAGASILYEQQAHSLHAACGGARRRSMVGAAAPGPRSSSRRRTALAAIGVERLLGTARIVVRPLPDRCTASPIVAGASLDARRQSAIGARSRRASSRRGAGSRRADAQTDAAAQAPGAGRRRFADHADAGTEHSRIGRLRRGCRQLRRGGPRAGTAQAVTR